MRGKAKWEHLNDDLHVLVTVEDAKNRATTKLKHAVEQVKKLLVPSVSRPTLLRTRLVSLHLETNYYRAGQIRRGHLTFLLVTRKVNAFIKLYDFWQV